MTILNMQKLLSNFKLPQVKAAMFYLLSMSTLLSSILVYADDEDTLNFVAGISQQRDSNLFRGNSSEISDVITKSSAGVHVDKPYQQHRLRFEYTHTNYEYKNNTFLNFDANEYKAAWTWVLTPYLTGILSAERSQSQYGFLDFNTRILNISTTEKRTFEADFSPHGSWHVLAGFTQSSRADTQQFNADSAFNQDGVDLGLRYIFSSGSSFTLQAHDRKGAYVNRRLDAINFFDSSFNEREAEATLDWRLSGNSNLYMRTAYVNREHDNFSQRDYSGLVGRVNYSWAPTGKFALSLVASHDLASFQSTFSNYTRNEALTIAPVYAMTSKINLKASVGLSKRTFVGGDDIAGNGRVDTTKLESVGIDWKPYRNISLGANVQRNERSSNVAGINFSDTITGLNANLNF